MRRAALILALLAASCHRQPTRGLLITKAALANVEQAVVTCTAATSAFGPLMARGETDKLRYAAIDARNRCSIARSDIAAAVGTGGVLGECRQTVDAQVRVAIAELKALDAPSAQTRSAVVAALDQTIPLQTTCGASVQKAKAGVGV